MWFLPIFRFPCRSILTFLNALLYKRKRQIMSRIEVPCEVCQNIHETHQDSPGVPVSLGDQEVQNEQGNISPKPPEGILIESSHA